MQPLLAVIEKNERNYDLEKIKRAFLYAKELHAGQFRLSGEPYVCHPVAVAEIVAQLGLDTDSICAALLHDTVEDCSDKTNLKEIEKMFGKSVAELVDGLTKNVEINVVFYNTKGTTTFCDNPSKNLSKFITYLKIP